MASSHTGSPRHVERVSRILARIGLSASHLACGYHEPHDPESRALLTERPESRSALYNNCSGKHAGMLCLALSEGWPVEHYESADHPVQRLMRQVVAEACGLAPETLSVAIDGCSVSVFGVPLERMARAYARLAAAAAEGDPRARALARIRAAMQAFPSAVGGAGRLSTELMEASGGRLVAKGGAEGLECAGVPARRLGVALKCEDGGSRAVPPALISLLAHLGLLSEIELHRLERWHRPVLTNHAGLEVGRLEARIRVLTPAAR